MATVATDALDWLSLERAPAAGR